MNEKGYELMEEAFTEFFKPNKPKLRKMVLRETNVTEGSSK